MRGIELLVVNEKMISKLYAIYADKFPGEKEFWLKKAGEEDTHAELLQALRSIIRESNSFFEKGRFSIEAIELSISYLKGLIQKAPNHSLVNALSMARDVENSLIEQGFFKVISGDSIQLVNTLLKIEQDTKRHKEEIQDLWIKYTSK